MPYLVNKYRYWYQTSVFFLFRDQDDQATQWRLKLYPKGDTAEASGHLSVYLSNQTGAGSADIRGAVPELPLGFASMVIGT